jgi:hypothetical protein
MSLGVFIHRPDSIYDDRPAERYQFPRQYLGRVQACLGDWILYYEPRKLFWRVNDVGCGRNRNVRCRLLRRESRHP